MSGRLPGSSHWGAFRAVADGGTLTVEPHELDPNPSGMLHNLDAIAHQARITHPMIRRGWLEHRGDSAASRGRDDFVRVEWPFLIDVLADELSRIIERYGNEAVYGGSYGWGSAGRFHHPQSQLHRFLNQIGGYTRSVNTYSTGASSVILPHVLGGDVDAVHGLTDWSVLIEHTTLIVAFGGIPGKNMQVAPGGIARHRSESRLAQLATNGTRIVVVSPQRDDGPEGAHVRWCPINPGTDVAMMLALAWVLMTGQLHDADFLRTRCAGFDELRAYILGDSDGVPKTPEWAAPITGVPAATMDELAREMVANRTFITVTWSLQRAEHGEQPPWMGIALASILGQVGQPGGGFGHGYGSMGDVGLPARRNPLPTLPQGVNPVDAFIPVARVSDMLLHPGRSFDYDGAAYRYPHIRLVYWCGGNPFHHHQDLGRLRRALMRPETVVVHEQFWTATARHADIVVPAAMSVERADIGASRNDPILIAMPKLIDPPGEARTDYDTFSDLAAALGVASEFTEGRSETAWLRKMYERWRAESGDVPLPPFDEFWARGHTELPPQPEHAVMLREFVHDPVGTPLSTPSGRIELSSSVIRAFGYDDCPPHPTWLPSSLSTDPRWPLILIAAQPARRLHSQLDMGAFSQDGKVSGREPLLIHPNDADQRGVEHGAVVLVQSEQGRCLAGAVVTDRIKAGCVRLATGAWYDPADPADLDALCVHGNPNVLTADRGTSRLAQGCTGQLVSVQVRRYGHEAPPVTAFRPPRSESAASVSVHSDPRSYA